MHRPDFQELVAAKPVGLGANRLAWGEESMEELSDLRRELDVVARNRVCQPDAVVRNMEGMTG